MEAGKKLKDQVYDALLSDIIEGIYLPNAILTERALIDKYGVSKSPIREALIELCKENVLKSLPRLGYQVVPISLKEISDILELRLILEEAALERAMNIITPKQIQSLKDNVKETSKIHNEKVIVKHWKGNISFHLLLCSFCGNQALYNAIERTLRVCSRGATQYFSKSWNRKEETNAQYHRKLIAAIEKKDADKAKGILSADILEMKREIVEGIAPAMEMM